MKYNTLAVSRTRVAVAVEWRECYSRASTTSLEQTEESEIFHPYIRRARLEIATVHISTMTPLDCSKAIFLYRGDLTNKTDRIYIVVHYKCHDRRKVYIKKSLERSQTKQILYILLGYIKLNLE